MTDITITPADVLAGGDAVIENGRAGATITAGQVVYKEASSGKFKLTDTNSGTTEVKNAYGIALNGASDGQPLAVQKSGSITIGGTVVAGTAYYASETPGGIQPAADVATEDVTFLGIATTAAIIKLGIINSGVTVA